MEQTEKKENKELSILEKRILELEQELISVKVENSQLKSDNSKIRVELSSLQREKELSYQPYRTDDYSLRNKELTHDELVEYYNEIKKERKK